MVRHLAAGDTLPGDHAAIDEREGTSTWQDALAALARRCDLVLMDLRGFQAHNAGCVHELGVLARCRARVVALTDAHTDQAAAQQAAAGAPDGHYIWLEAGEHSRGRVLQALFNAMTD